jgi:uncharacterized protein (UPF0335 family)
MGKKWVAIVGAVVSIVAGILAIYIQLGSRQGTIRLNLNEGPMTGLEELSKRLKSELIPEISKEILAQANSTTPIFAAEKLAALENRIEAVDNQTLALRQAINPTKPDEVLTIARLTDEIKDIREDFSDVRKQLESQQQSFQSSILRELKSSNDSTTLILVVLVPLILNFLYTVWKDLKSVRSKDDS